VEKIENLGFLGKIFQTQTQTKDGLKQQKIDPTRVKKF